MLNELNRFIKDDEFSLTIYKNQIHIKNYLRIISLENNYISFKTTNNKITIHGNNLSLKKLVIDEMLIEGKVSKIEVQND